MPIKLFLILFVSIIGTSCNTKKIKRQCDENLLFSKGLVLDAEVPNKRNKEFVAAFFSALDSSDYQKAYNILNTSTTLQKDSLNRYSLSTPIHGMTNKESHYIIYRLQQYLGNITEKMLNQELTNVYNTEEQTTESILCLNRLAEIEFDFLSFYSLYDSIKKKEQINKFEKHLKEYPKSLRIQYLYGKLNYDMGFYNIGLPVFHNLLQKKYYENPILELMFEFYSIIDDDSVMHYAKVFSDRFPDNCNLGNLSVLIKQNQDSLFMEECEKCLKSEKLTDSIKAKIEMAKFYLNTRDFLKVKRLYNDYKIKNKDFTFNDFKIWETGEYYDIFLRSLFLQKRYRDFYEFIQNEMGYNKKINVENEKDFYKLIRKYHADYSESQSIEFDKFFNENFFLDQG